MSIQGWLFAFGIIDFRNAPGRVGEVKSGWTGARPTIQLDLMSNQTMVRTMVWPVWYVHTIGGLLFQSKKVGQNPCHHSMRKARRLRDGLLFFLRPTTLRPDQSDELFQGRGGRPVRQKARAAAAKRGNRPEDSGRLVLHHRSCLGAPAGHHSSVTWMRPRSTRDLRSSMV